MSALVALGPTEINDLPAHILLVHVVVVLIPLASLALVLSVLWPAARRRLGVVTPLLALVGLIAVPLTTHAGEWLEARLGKSPLIEKHAHLGGELLPWALALFVLALAHWIWSRVVARSAVPRGRADYSPSGSGGVAVAERTTTSTTTGQKVVSVVLGVLAIAVAVGSVWMVYRIGDSGSKAVWSGSF